GVLLALATVAGALGAHTLKGHWAAERLDVYDTAVRYQFYHSLGLFGIGLALRTVDVGALRAAAVLIVIGIVLFCGSLYALTLGAPRAFGAITPLGGLALMAGWLFFAYGVWRSESGFRAADRRGAAAAAAGAGGASVRGVDGASRGGQEHRGAARVAPRALGRGQAHFDARAEAAGC